MDTEIPPELLLPTVEELEKRTAQDLKAKWKPCKRLGKKERIAAKQKAIEEELSKSKQTIATDLSSLFVKTEKPKFSLCDVNAKTSIKPTYPTLRVSLGASSNSAESNISQNRKKGKLPKVKSL
jgi:hypothetical protein